MHVRMPALLLAARQHAETAVIARLLTEEYGVIAAYVAGGRGRRLRPVVIPGNRVDLQLAGRAQGQLPFATLELLHSRGALMTQPLPAAGIGWACALTATALPERQPYPALYAALGGLLDAIAHAPSARDWAGALLGYETLLLRDLGYGGRPQQEGADLAATLAALDRLAPLLHRYLLADRRGDVMAARQRLRGLLGRIV
ncbi:MAG: recombination protein O N-terminal domain-containing protein [Porphyrobacter sp.]|nr:recombination protein O N-terminal domain-containing protein [Porphyrobacter sp.]